MRQNMDDIIKCVPANKIIFFKECCEDLSLYFIHPPQFDVTSPSGFIDNTPHQNNRVHQSAVTSQGVTTVGDSTVSSGLTSGGGNITTAYSCARETRSSATRAGDGIARTSNTYSLLSKAACSNAGVSSSPSVKTATSDSQIDTLNSTNALSQNTSSNNHSRYSDSCKAFQTSLQLVNRVIGPSFSMQEHKKKLTVSDNAQRITRKSPCSGVVASIQEHSIAEASSQGAPIDYVSIKKTLVKDLGWILKIGPNNSNVPVETFFYFTPRFNDKRKYYQRIENLEVFTSDALDRHIDSNPCFGWDGVEILSALESSRVFVKVNHGAADVCYLNKACARIARRTPLDINDAPPFDRLIFRVMIELRERVVADELVDVEECKSLMAGQKFWSADADKSNLLIPGIHFFYNQASLLKFITRYGLNLVADDIFVICFFAYYSSIETTQLTHDMWFDWCTDFRICCRLTRTSNRLC